MDRIAENRLDRLTSLIKLDIVKTLQATFEDTLQSSYFDYRKSLNTTMFNIVEHALAEGVRSFRGHIVTESELCRPARSRSAAEPIVNAFLSSTAFIVPIYEIVCNLVDRALD